MRPWKIITSFLLMLLLATPLLFLSCLQARQAYLKHEMEERLEKGLLKTVFIPKKDWHPLNRREIVVEGKLFDLKDVRAEADGYTVTGVFDDEETILLQQIDRSCNTKTSKDTPVFAQFFQLLHGLFFQTSNSELYAAALSSQLFQNPIVVLPLFYKQIASPPPRMCA